MKMVIYLFICYIVQHSAELFILHGLNAFAWPIKACSFQARRHKNTMQGLNLFVLLWRLPQTSSAAGLTGTEDRRKKEGFWRNGWTMRHYAHWLAEMGSHVTLGMLMRDSPHQPPPAAVSGLWWVYSKSTTQKWCRRAGEEEEIKPREG